MIASDFRSGGTVSRNLGSRAAAGNERKLRDSLILVALVASPSVGLLLLSLAR